MELGPKNHTPILALQLNPLGRLVNDQVGLPGSTTWNYEGLTGS